MNPILTGRSAVDFLRRGNNGGEAIKSENSNLFLPKPIRGSEWIYLWLRKPTGYNGISREKEDGTRPDLAYAVSRLSRYTSNPSYAHWKAITRVLHYLRYSRDYGLHYDRHPAVIEGYSDANWISDIKDSRSTSGYVFTLGGAAISWKSSKQTVIAKSTMESEFIALDKCGEEAEWLRQFVEDIPRWPKPVTAISIHCDSKSAMGRAKSTMYNGKSRHIRRRHNSIRQLLSTGVISIDYVASKDNIADPFTKGLSRELVSKLSSPDVQQLWTLYPGKQTGNLFPNINIALDGLSEKYDHVSDIIIHREPFSNLKMVHSIAVGVEGSSS
ncbi:hypothetical protein Tco_0743714 [Tanacetum coccineum]